MAVEQLNTVDVVLLVLLLLFALHGLSRGLILGALDLLGLGVSAVVAYQAQPLVVPYLVESVGLPQSLADIVAFLAIFVVCLVAFVVVAGFTSVAVKPLLALASLGCINTLGGGVVGLAKGVVVVGLALHGLALLPFVGEIRTEVAKSDVAVRVGQGAVLLLPYLETIVGQVGEETMRFVPPIREGERRSISVPRGISVWPDADAEERMLQLLNRERIGAGLPPLVADDQLRQVARLHSEEMFRLAYFAHESAVSGTLVDRLRRGSVSFGAAGENLAYAPTVDGAHRGLMNSPEHKKNILSPAFRRVGIGVIQSGLWGRMFTQDFAD